MTELLSITQAAHIAHVSRQAIHLAIVTGKIRAKKATPAFNAPFLIEAPSLQIWIKQRAQPRKRS
jgi:hypothetical protein